MSRGQQRIPAMGNVQHNILLTLKGLVCGPYY